LLPSSEGDSILTHPLNTVNPVFLVQITFFEIVRIFLVKQSELHLIFNVLNIQNLVYSENVMPIINKEYIINYILLINKLLILIYLTLSPKEREY